MAKTKLQLPLGALLDDRQPEARVHRLWQRLEAARAGRSDALRSRVWAFSAITIAIISVLVFWFERASKAGALRLADGRPVPVVMGHDERSHVALDDESVLDVAAGGRLEVLESTVDKFSLALRRGTTEFEVHPGGPRAWRIECAGVLVEVVGTHFTVKRTATSLRVSVSRGVVLVRGESVPDRVVRLSAGQAIVVPLSASPSAAVPFESSSATPGGGMTTLSGARPTSRIDDPDRKTTESPREIAAGNANSPSAANLAGPGSAGSASNRAAFPEGSGTTPQDVDLLMGEADTLRRAGKFHDAAVVLERIVAEHGSDRRSALAEFSLGRLYLDSLGSPAVASTHFAKALARHLPATLAEDGRARLVEADARAGDRIAAKQAAMEYRALYPNGRRLVDVNRWVDGTF